MSSPQEESSGLLANETPGDNAGAMSVSEVSGALKRTVEGAFARVRVRGEISGWKRAASGHCYLALKDDKAVLDAVMWRGTAQRLAFAPEDGAEVVATGKLTTYPGRSKYQIVVDALELAGQGALMALLDKRRRQLAAEGLFAEERKKPLPYLPRTIGVVTSPTGAVIRDILHRLEDRFPTHVVLWPVVVQGEGAADKVAAAIRGFDSLGQGGPVPRPDLLIVARGGGSIEDLWAFNEEVVVRAAADCSIPLISAVGHETDTTLIDYASDRRAPTPTAAAEMAVPVRRELAAYVGEQGRRAGDALSRRLDRAGERFDLVRERLPEGESLFALPNQRLDDAVRRLGRGLRERATEAAGRLSGWTGRLDASRLLGNRLSDDARRVENLYRQMTLLHPERPLSKGFARVEGADGKTIMSAKAARAAASLKLHFADGAMDAVPSGKAARPRKVAKKPATAYRPGQPGLFDEPGDEE
ncbi:exodeoxyribonuclease VII large subunit [Sphingomicrobium clamense]|uniref:Exodeoxyribonuclease 7 large subunit n=1 Tax=Sphingomicrobium clamense TaxID=2851013 RepID=A0ABS6V3Q1_9SPHN|nr:exodeoxyribonuclease VII large subunit [Sphingomicrobium sp. B8]MBW0144178.1 exodeoxyribonuclease VII large subunit [Sphingomicrobium sp. B8]